MATAGEDANGTKQMRAQVRGVEILTRTDEATIKAGEQLFTDSITVLRDFAKTMITTSSGFTLVYLGALSFLRQSSQPVGSVWRLAVILPALCFLVATAFAILMLVPVTERFSLDVLEEVEAARETWLGRRRVLMWVTAWAFLVGVLTFICIMSVLFLQ